MKVSTPTTAKKKARIDQPTTRVVMTPSIDRRRSPRSLGLSARMRHLPASVLRPGVSTWCRQHTEATDEGGTSASYPGAEPGLRSAADSGTAAGAKVRAGRELSAAFGAVLDGGRERLAAAHAEARARRVLRLAGRAHRAGRGLRRPALLRPALRLAVLRAALAVGRHPRHP